MRPPPSPLLERVRAHPPAAVAITTVGGPETLTYGALGARAAEIAAALGPQGGAAVAFLVEAGPRFVEVLLGVLHAGGVAVPLSPLHTRPELAHIVDDAAPGRLIASPDLAARLREAAGARPVARTDDLRPADGPRAPEPPAATAPAIMLYTSGTTGRPKGVVLSHAAVAATVIALEEAWRWRADDRLLHVLPLHHTHGLIVALLGALWAGAETRFATFDAARAWELLGDFSVFMAVPTVYAKLMEAFRAARPETRALWAAAARRPRLFTSGSAALPAALLEEFRAASGQTILERYGMTEIGMALGNPYDGPRVPGAVGLPLPAVEVEIIADDGRPAAVGEAGELRVRTPQLFLGYHGDAAATAASFDGEGRFRTGDTCARDADGWVRVLGRTSVDIIKSGGYKISALEIEAALRDHPAVADVAVIGAPDSTWGERVTACVVVRPDAALTLDELQAFARERLAPYKVPRALRVLEALPRNAMGKVQKKKLQQSPEPQDPELQDPEPQDPELDDGHVIRLAYSNQTEQLLDALAEDLGAAGGSLFDATTLVVPNPQVEAYVKLGLARRNGVAAHIESRHLRRFLAEVAAATAPDVALCDRPLIQGELLALFHDERRLAAEALEPVRRYLGDDAEAIDLRRVQLSDELAALLDEYAYARPEMLRAWRDGRPSESGADLSVESWQRALWLALFGAGGAFETRGRAQGRRYLTAPAFFEGCDPAALRPPPAVYVFGISYVARLYRHVFGALGQATALHVYTLNPCREFWEDLRTAGARRARAPSPRKGQQLGLFGGEADVVSKDDDLPDNPILSLWGRPGRENVTLLDQLSDCDFAARFRDPLAASSAARLRRAELIAGGAGPSEGPEYVESAAPTLLAQLQHDVLDRVPARRGAERLDIADDTITILPCPDPRRELETVAAEIWALVRRDEELRRGDAAAAPPPLRFTDVAVIVPLAAADVYLPLAPAVLGEASDLPHQVIDAPAGGEGRVREAVALLLGLPLGPLGRQDLLRLVMHPAVAGRFPDADPDDWLALSEALEIVRGADRDDHAGSYVEGDRFNWDQGLRRLALGAFVAGRRSGEERPFALGGARYLPAELGPDLEESAQAFAILARSLIAFARGAREGTRTVAEWTAVLRRAIATTILPSSPEDEAALTRVLAELQRVEAAAPPDLRVRYRVACELARAALAALPNRGARHLTEGITVSTFLPMRAVPFRVVFVVGLGERAFPSSDRASELDLRAARRLPGDVTPREQDEYVFLETLLCARERLVLSYVDRHPVTAEPQGPSSTVEALLEVLEGGYLGAAGRARITRPAPPLRRHEDDAACAVIPAAARERRAAALGESLRAGGVALPDWPALRAALAPSALATIGAAVRFAPPSPAAPAAREEHGRRVLTLGQLIRFLECPLQGSARVHLPLGGDDLDGDAEAYFREHEDFEAVRMRALPLLHGVLLTALGADPRGADATLESAYDAAAEVAALDGTLPAGTFGAAARGRHLDLLRAWRDGLAGAGTLETAPAPIFFGSAPEYRRGIPIEPPLALTVEVGGGDARRSVRVDVHGATRPIALVGGVPTSLGLLASSTRDSGYSRDHLRAWIDHVALSAAGHAAPEGRRVILLRAGDTVDKPTWFAPLAVDTALAYLGALAADLLEGIYPWFLPCEGILGWKRRDPPRPPLTDFVLMLREDDWTRFTSDWGPVPDARGYPTPPEAEAQDIVARRFQPFFDAQPPVERRRR